MSLRILFDRPLLVSFFPVSIHGYTFYKFSITYVHNIGCSHTLLKICIFSEGYIKGYIQGTHGTGKTGKMATKNSLSGKTQGLWKFGQNTGNLVCSSWKCSDSKSKGFCDICRKKNPFFCRSWLGLPSQFCVCNSHKICKLAQGKFAFGQGKKRENTGNLKIQFEWLPCI